MGGGGAPRTKRSQIRGPMVKGAILRYLSPRGPNRRDDESLPRATTPSEDPGRGGGAMGGETIGGGGAIGGRGAIEGGAASRDGGANGANMMGRNVRRRKSTEEDQGCPSAESLRTKQV